MSGAWRERDTSAAQPAVQPAQGPDSPRAATAQACRPESITIQSSPYMPCRACVLTLSSLDPRSSLLEPQARG